MKRLCIVGGGIAGLSAAWRAQQLGADYVLYEQAPRLGGVIATEIVEGCVVEGGPDSFLTEKPAAAALCRELGLGNELIGSNDAERSTSILINGRLVPLPDGLQFLVPTKIWPTAASPLFSFSTKLRFAREYLAPPAPSREADESVASFVRRHFGNEVVDRLADPLLSGIYGGSAERLSARAVLPRMLEMERKHGSLVRATLAARRNRKPPASGATPPLFTSLRGGMQQLVDALIARLHPQRLRTGCAVRRLERDADQWLVTVGEGGRAERFDALILALPAYAASALLGNISEELGRLLSDTNYTSSITVVLGYDEAATRGANMKGFGFLVPRNVPRGAPSSAPRSRADNGLMLACTFVHHKFPHRAPAGLALLRCFIGGDQAERALTLSDADIIAAMRAELRESIHLATEPGLATPLFARVFRWPRAMAQYEVGHMARLGRVEALCLTLPGLGLAGNAYRGIGVPDCIRTGLDAVNELLAATPAHPPG